VDLGMIEKEVGRLRFKTPNKLTVTLDENKVVHARVALHQF
jgi:hypothetical protein